MINVGKGNYKKFGGLGPNIGIQQVIAKGRNDARMEFDEGVRVLNKKKRHKSER
jgi:hypothetical protein